MAPRLLIFMEYSHNERTDGAMRGAAMFLTVDQIETLAVVGIICWIISKLFAPPSRPRRGSEKLCEPWWKSSHS